MKELVAILLMTLLCTGDAVAADWKPVKGTYAITARNYLDPSDEEASDSHVRFQLSGETAKDLYQAMKAAEKPDECTGATAKEIGGMQCLYYKGEKTYACHFALDIAQQKIEYGVTC